MRGNGGTGWEEGGLNEGKGDWVRGTWILNEGKEGLGEEKEETE